MKPTKSILIETVEKELNKYIHTVSADIGNSEIPLSIQNVQRAKRTAYQDVIRFIKL